MPDDALSELRGGDVSPAELKQAREAELEAIRRSIEVSERRQAALREEIEGLDKDTATLNADLIATARRQARPRRRSPHRGAARPAAYR